MKVSEYDNSEQLHNHDWFLRNRIRQTIANDQRIQLVDRSSIQVTVLNGLVMLTGVVRQVTSKTLAYGDALKTDGVTDVIDSLAYANKKTTP